jgi:hypothetical protein
MAKQTAQIDPSGGAPELEIRFGDANVGACPVVRWDAGGDPVHLAQTVEGTIMLGPAAALNGVTISYEAIIQSPKPGGDQPYSIMATVRQGGATVPGGLIEDRG